MSKNDRQALKHIAALLFAFATLADLAGSKPRPLRAAVLWLLRAAEVIGRDFVSTMVEDCGGLEQVQVSSLDEADDSMRLAHSFRALAELLGGLIRCDLALLLDRTGRGLIGVQLRKLQTLAYELSPWERTRLDTS